MNMFQDVLTFMVKMKIPMRERPTSLARIDKALVMERMRHLYEELYEFERAWEADDLADQADGLVDMVYIILGTALVMGLPWYHLWAAVQAANMRKELSEDTTKKCGVIKPPGWQPPDIKSVLLAHGALPVEIK